MKKLSNKGFSLVELIIVIAIMAVLMGILAPQLVKYVEQSRRQTDESMLDEVKNATQLALSDEAAYSDPLTDGASVVISDGAVVTSTSPSLEKEIHKTVAEPITFSSKYYKSRGGESITVTYIVPYQTYVLDPSWD